jgi:4-hydroxybenzoate polyprenyltransferase
VKTSPNSKFTGIEAIKKAQIKAGDRQIEGEDSDMSEDSASTLSCIEIEE